MTRQFITALQIAGLILVMLGTIIVFMTFSTISLPWWTRTFGSIVVCEGYLLVYVASLVRPNAKRESDRKLHLIYVQEKGIQHHANPH